MKYLVIEVGCLECLGEGSCEPTVELATNDIHEAILRATKDRHTNEYDLFVVDTQTGDIHTPNGRYER